MRKTIRPSIWILGCLFGLLYLAACKKENDPIPPQDNLTEKPGQIPGFGETPGPPEGTPFVLPKGITLKGAIVGEESGPDAGQCVFDGAGFWVSVTITLQNDSTGSGPIQVEFPAGLVVVSAAEGFQNGLLIERVLVTVPPKVTGGGGGTCKVTLMCSCLNASRKPADGSAQFTLGPVTSSPLMKDFIRRLSTKKIQFSDYQGSDDFFINQEYVQDALWSITDGEGLTENDLRRIQNLPNK